MSKTIAFASTGIYGVCFILLCVAIGTTHWIYGHIVSEDEDMKWHVGVFRGCVTHLDTGYTVCVSMSALKNLEFPASVMEFVPGAFLCVNSMLLFVSSAVGLMKLQSADNVTVYAVIKTQGLIGFGRLFTIAFGLSYYMVRNYHDVSIDGGIGWSFYLACACAVLDIVTTTFLCTVMSNNTQDQHRIHPIEIQPSGNTPAMF